MASDEELVEKLQEFLRSSDLSTTTTGAVRRHLEVEFAADLSAKKGFIRDQVDQFLTSQMNNNEDQEDQEEKEEQEDQEEGNGDGNGEEEEEEVEMESKKKKSKKRSLSKCNDNKEEKKRGNGFTKACSLSEELQSFVGEPTLARTEVVKRLWAYIKENNLQDEKNKRKILCDETLKNLFKVNSIDMFQMNKALTKHIWPLEDGDNNGAGGSSKPKEKPEKKEKQNDGSGKKQKTGQTGLQAPLKISEELKGFLGTGESSLARTDVVKRMWAYIKENNLQDPADRRNILCDDKLKELFKVDSFNGFSVTKYLTPHFIKKD